MLAFDAALRAPGLFRGVLLVDGPIHPETAPDLARRAASLGLRTAYVLDRGTSTAHQDGPALVARVREWLQECGFPDVDVVRRAEADSPGEEGLVRAILERWNGTPPARTPPR